ncbi:MAG: 1-deoxy-D-xylulose-5-phosphate synthase [Ferrimicrobium sp.]|uniref:1-deoxy-D-xylulose-5-phosphate synthase n=1 Tax=Ferrimicrobium sp. TaxID=2926050 RepID=UPI002635E421|nr:1-deoxy-D-xylulose-5-phosphate synthase [Ferrimicrobium sp.]
MELENVKGPSDLAELSNVELEELAQQIRQRIIDTVSRNGGHLGSNLGSVEITLALHRSFDSPRDVLLFDTGHQAYPHKLLTGRNADFDSLRRRGGLSGYPNRSESEHDWIENSHASTALSYAYGMAAAFQLAADDPSVLPLRRVVAVVGDGALTGGMAYEALNNIGHRRLPIIIIWNDNGRSYAPTISRLSSSLTKLRLNPSYIQARNRIKQVITDLPKVGNRAVSSLANMTSALREAIEPRVFFEALGVRYTGPIDGHDISELEYALAGAKEWNGPIVVHVLTQKGKGYAPAEEDELQCLHDLKVPQVFADIEGDTPASYTEAFSKELVQIGKENPSVVVLTAAMGGPTGLLPFEEAFPTRFFDVGIAEQHAVTSAAGMAMAGLHPVVAIYSTFMSRAFDQVNLDVGLHGLGVTFVMDRAGVTGDDGPSHHGIFDLVQMLSVANLTVFVPSSVEELRVQLRTAIALEGPSSLRFSKSLAPRVVRGGVGEGLHARVVREGSEAEVILGIGKMLVPALLAADLLEADGYDVAVIDPRVIRPCPVELIERLVAARRVITVEDGLIHGGAGEYIAQAVHRINPQVEFCNLGIPTEYLPHGNVDTLLTELGLDGLGIAGASRAFLAQTEDSARRVER